jgi:hypothetical protein
VRLFGVSPDGDVDGNDKLYMGMHCAAVPPTTSGAASACPLGQFATGASDGTVQCQTLADVAVAYLKSQCTLYFGWRDNCDGCSDPPTKWGRMNDSLCENGVGTNDTCTQPTLGTESVRLFGLSTDGDVNGDDTFYVGLHCTGAVPASGPATGTCPPGQFVREVLPNGTLTCESAATAIEAYARTGCFAYLGWRDGCDGCTSAPAKWGRAADTVCENGTGNGTCITATLGTESVNLYALNTDGDVGGDDKIYVGLECR